MANALTPQRRFMIVANANANDYVVHVASIGEQGGTSTPLLITKFDPGRCP